MQGEHERVFNLRNCVVNQMLLNRAKLGELFRQCGQKELDFLVNSGIWFGFLLGLIQMAVALLWDNPWSLSLYVNLDFSSDTIEIVVCVVPQCSFFRFEL